MAARDNGDLENGASLKRLVRDEEERAFALPCFGRTEFST